MNRTKKKFDCVEMKRRGALRIHRETKDLSFAEKVEYWNRQSDDMRREQDQLARPMSRRKRLKSQGIRRPH